MWQRNTTSSLGNGGCCFSVANSICVGCVQPMEQWTDNRLETSDSTDFNEDRSCSEVMSLPCASGPAPPSTCSDNGRHNL